MQSSNPTPSSSWKKLFSDPLRAFGFVSALLLALLAIAPAKNYFSEWRHYQKGYLRLIRSRGDAITLQRHFQPGIQQIWHPELGVTDRCTSCHVGLKEASLTDVSLQPYRMHPVIPHTTEQFGCVMCHRGQGAATTVEEAHSSTLAWEQPILPERYIESGCGQCHGAGVEGTPQLNQGRAMLARYGCVQCHTIKLADGSVMHATQDAPSLSHVADKTTREWIFAWLKDPQAYAASATMPNFKLKDEDIRDISAFLIANSTPLAGDTASPIILKAIGSYCRRQPLWRIVLLILSCCAECCGKRSGRQRRSGTHSHRHQGETRVVARMGAQSPHLRSQNGDAALSLYRSAGRDHGRLPARKDGFRLSRQCPSRCRRRPNRSPTARAW